MGFIIAFVLSLGFGIGHEVGFHKCKGSAPKQVTSADVNQDTTTDEEVYARAHNE